MLPENFGNSSKEENKVYYCIYNKDTDTYTCSKIFIEPNYRKQMKQELSQIILEELWNILTTN